MPHRYFNRYFVALSLGVVCLCAQRAVGEGEYSPRDFVSAAPAQLFYTEDEMTEDDKRSLVKRGFKKSKSFDCSQWGVAEETKDRLVLQYCADSSVTVQVFRTPADHNGVVVAVASVRASGRASDLELFKVTKTQKDFTPLSESQRTELGITALTENDFLTEAQRFPASETSPVKLVLGETGELRGELMTWMDPRWENREQAYEVAFVWDQGKFSQRRRELPKASR